MGSGEADAIRDIAITNTKNTLYNTLTYPYYDSTTTTTPFTSTWTYGTYIYLYQIKCPKRGCKTNNWLELGKVTPCIECGSKLRAVAAEDIADFETVVDKKR